MPDEVGKWWGFGEVEFVKHDFCVIRPSVHGNLAISTSVMAALVSGHVIEDCFQNQPRRLVVDDPMEAFVQDDKKEGFELVCDLEYLARVFELFG